MVERLVSLYWKECVAGSAAGAKARSAMSWTIWIPGRTSPATQVSTL